MTERIGQTVFMAKSESQDFDCIASWVVGDEQQFEPVQLKEAVPIDLNPRASLQSVMNPLTKYGESKGLTVAIQLSQATKVDFRSLVIPPLSLAAIWVFAASSPDQEHWNLFGNFMETPEVTPFKYPT